MDAVNTNRALVALTVAAWVAQVLYIALPVDLVPDLLPVVGWFDDLVGLSGTLGLTAFTVKRLMDEGVRRIEERAVYEPIDPAELRAL